MNHVGHIPLVRLVIPFIMGISTWLIAQGMVSQWVFISLYLAGIIIWLAFRHFLTSHYSNRWLFGVLFSFLFFISGYHHAQNHFQIARPDHFSKWYQQVGYLKMIVTEPVSEKARSYQVIGRVKQFRNDTLSATVSGKLMIYLQKDSAASALRYGDVLIIENQYQEVRPPQNPGEFDYRSYLARLNIYHQGYRGSKQWYFIGENHGLWIKGKAIEIQQSALDRLELRLPQREFAIVSALLLGYRETLDQGLQKEFSGAGAMHILCVSGLHVGIIYMVLIYMLAFIKRIRHGIFIQTLLIILLIWFYAAITGFAPSVGRAATMFSLLAIGQSFHRNTNIYNTLAASALVLVLIDPYVIMHVGFQLSYLAVAGIVALQPWLYQRLYFKQYFLDRAWAIITVSIAAQLATGPLAVYYFNQFPNYFILTNLAVIPLASLIIYTALLTLIFTPLPFLGVWMGKVLYVLVYVLQASVRFIEGLPHAVSSGVYITLPETLLIFAILLSLLLLISQGFRPGLLIAMGLSLFLAASVSVRTIQNSNEKEVIVYQVNNALAIDFISGRHCVFLCCDTVNQNPQMVDYNISGNRLGRGIRKPENSLVLSQKQPWQNSWLYRNENFLRFYNTTFFILDDNFNARLLPKESPTIDYLIITQNPRIELKEVLPKLNPAMVIFDATNSHWNLRRWEESCTESGVNFWTVSHQGSLLIKGSTRKG